MKKPVPDLSIVIPAYREAKRLGLTLDKLADFLQTNPILGPLDIEVLVVSADSVDRTHEIVEQKSNLFADFVFLKPGPRVGKGRDVRVGMLAARGKAVIFMDADLATPLAYVPFFYRSFEAGSSVVVATRNLRKHHPNVLRRSLSYAGNALYRILGGVWIEDSQCGFKLFSHEAAQRCFTKMTTVGWGFDMEVLTIAKTNGYAIKTVRVDDWKSVPNGTFTEGAFKSSITSLIELFHIFGQRIRGKYRIE